ncbi:MAG: hypothetical protein IJD33_01945 [Clostridia bacterium]|nr:hypothetical protein [Clostridia bacterium]
MKKAEKLRLANERADKKEEKVISEWNRKRAKAKTNKEKKRLDGIYGKRCDKADKEASKAYKDYYDYIHKNFSSAETNKALKLSGNFTQKAFLQKLFFPVTKKSIQKKSRKSSANKNNAVKARKKR